MEAEKKMSENITISVKRYEELLKAEDELRALENMGVDNWEGYSDAMKSLND